MSICSAGVSQRKSSTPASVLVDAAYAKSLLPSGLAWAYDYLPFMHGLEIGDTSVFCAADPPTWTVPSGADILGFLTGGPYGAYVTVNQFLQDVTKAYLWYGLCECASVTTPAPPTAPTAPTDLPSINPPNVVAPPTDAPACHDQSIATPISSGGPYSYNSWLWHGSPSNLTSIRLTITQPQDFIATSAPVSWTLYQTTNSSITVISTLALPPSFNHSVDIPVLPLTTEFRLLGTAPYNQTAPTVIRIQGFCGPSNPSGGAASGCCPPDPAVTAMLSRMEQAITLIQRQSTPFAYVYGANHTGLTGDGEIAIQGLLGVSVDVTATPSTVGSSAGTPQHLFDVGYVTLGTADGWLRARRIDADGTLEIPPAAAGALTRVGYTLEPGVTIALRELVREP